MRQYRSMGILAAAALSLGGLAAASTTTELIDVPRHGPGRRRTHIGTSKYMPHQGAREIGRRLRQQARLAASRLAALETING